MAHTQENSMLFETTLNWLSGDRGILHAHNHAGPIYVTTPQEFGGSGNEWSPEQLFLSSVASCYMSTFLFFAKKRSVAYKHIECSVKGLVQLIAGKYQFTEINLHAVIFIDAGTNAAAVEAVLDKTEHSCLVSNSIKTPVNYQHEIKEHIYPLSANQETNISTAAK